MGEGRGQGTSPALAPAPIPVQGGHGPQDVPSYGGTFFRGKFSPPRDQVSHFPYKRGNVRNPAAGPFWNWVGRL